MEAEVVAAVTEVLHTFHAKAAVVAEAVVEAEASVVDAEAAVDALLETVEEEVLPKNIEHVMEGMERIALESLVLYCWTGVVHLYHERISIFDHMGIRRIV